MSNNYNNNFNTYSLSQLADDDSEEMISLISSEEDLSGQETPEVLPILPVRNTVLFPGVVIPITVGRQKSIKLVKKAYRGNRIIGVVAQANPKKDEPTFDDLYKVGTVAKILKMIVLPDGNTTIIIQGSNRFKIGELVQEDPFITAKVEAIAETFPEKLSRENKALIQSLKETATKIMRLNPEIPKEAQVALDNIESPVFLTHFLSSNINADVLEKQLLLEINDGIARATQLLEHMLRELHFLEIKQEINSKVHQDIDQQQRDFFLRQQIKVLQDELGYEGPDQEVETLRAKAMKKKLPENVMKHLNRELDKILRLNQQSAEYPLAVNYCELMVDLPWGEVTKDNFDLVRAQKILDHDHYGMEKIKERIIEYLAVLKLKNNLKAPILCLYGPPGVGKTSLGRSIAKALGRKYVRMSLGGLHDESEVRGHRKTYIGAMPGKIIQGIRKSESSNPVFILDEIDKVGTDFRGDPSSALLEVLDPEQNSTFADNYLEVEYDLSKVLFIATANSLDTIQPALRDRMEILELTGYTLQEKVEIAKKHLVPRQKKDHGIGPKSMTITDDALVKIIEGYTSESGVRSLERQIGTVVRKIAKSIAMEQPYKKNVNAAEVVKLLGAEYFDKDLYEHNDFAGVAVGLAWTSVGGDILFIETSLNKGKGHLTLSGQLGDVMKESATAALSYLKAHAEKYDIDYRLFDHFDLHIHFPAGAVPKDGPSAGITVATALASVFTQRKVKEKLAMTGEITLRGTVLPVGGIKEKILAAKRAGIAEIIMCSKNKRDIDEIPKHYISDLKFHFVDTVDQVLAIALLPEKVNKPIDLTIPENKANESYV